MKAGGRDALRETPMHKGPMSPVLRFVRRLGGTDAADEATDPHLLERFVSRRDEEAFAEG